MPISVDSIYGAIWPLFYPHFWLFLATFVIPKPSWWTLLLLIVAIVASFFKFGLPLIDQLVYGWAEKVDFRDAVVVITGGGRGLGRLMADMLVEKGAKVAILDIRSPADAKEKFTFIKTDVGDEKAVLQAKAKIEKQLGTPTILINNAGIVNGQTMLDLTTSDMENNFRVNLFSHFYTIRAFLPGMIAAPKGGTIVTVSSVMGILGGAQLSDYSAAKAGLSVMHTSLRAELDRDGNEKVKTILVKPGQLTTPLFSSIETPSTFFAPLVDTQKLAAAIIREIEGGWPASIAMPLFAQFGEWYTVLPLSWTKVIRNWSGIDRAMQGFVRK